MVAVSLVDSARSADAEFSERECDGDAQRWDTGASPSTDVPPMVALHKEKSVRKFLICGLVTLSAAFTTGDAQAAGWSSSVQIGEIQVSDVNNIVPTSMNG